MAMVFNIHAGHAEASSTAEGTSKALVKVIQTLTVQGITGLMLQSQMLHLDAMLLRSPYRQGNTKNPNKALYPMKRFQSWIDRDNQQQ